MECREERLLEWLYNNIASFIVYRESPINANRTAIYDDLIEQQRVAISAVETCRQLKKALFDKKNVTDKELVSLVLQLKIRIKGGKAVCVCPAKDCGFTYEQP